VRQALVFIGVSTGGSSIMRLFPRWAALLGLDAEIVGRDVPVRAEPHAFRAAVTEIAADERLRGALVTTHKLDVYRHAADLFTELDPLARLCREVSCISKRGDALVGHAKDPITAGQALAALVDEGYWRRTGAHVLCLGAGGSGTAITVHLLSGAAPPERIVVTDVDSGRITELRQIHARLERAAEVDYRRVSSAQETDALLAALPPGSLVVNATGLGKDLPGSPLSRAARFPERGIVWELNYRGELDFLREARRQAKERGLHVHGGWRYFLHGWTEVIAEVFGVALDADTVAALARAAEPFRPPS
jgi:shikimate 5-dehydrogenase